MLRCLLQASRCLRPIVNPTRMVYNSFNGYSTLTNNTVLCKLPALTHSPLASNTKILEISQNLNAVPVRTVTKFSLKKGKRKTVKAALRRFFRLDWGGWIRTKVGRQKKIWKKSQAAKIRAKQHVLLTATQTTLLDKMVTKYWKRPKYYVDDPYSPYHSREHFAVTRKKPIVR